MDKALVQIEVVYASVDRQCVFALDVPLGTSVREAVVVSRIAEQFPGLDLASCALGIFGKVIADPEAHQVQSGDRIEIYRPLLVDPKEVRRLRAAKAAAAKKREQ